MTSIVEIANLHVSFGGREVLRGASMTVERGGPTVLIGRSGTGKTTLLRAVNRLNECLPGCVTTGSVRLTLGGENFDAYAQGVRPEELRRRVGMVFQTPNPLPVSVYRNIALPLSLALNLSAADIRGRAERALTEAGLWDEVKDRLDQPAVTLSGGQQQRLCLARALAYRPELLLLDEPTASLDQRSVRVVEDLLLDLAGRYTVLVVSHNLRQAGRLARRLFVLGEGGAAREADPAMLTSAVDREALAALLDEMT